MYLVEHNSNFIMNPMLFNNFEEAIAFMKVLLATGRHCTIRQLKVHTSIKKETIKNDKV